MGPFHTKIPIKLWIGASPRRADDVSREGRRVPASKCASGIPTLIIMNGSRTLWYFWTHFYDFVHICYQNPTRKFNTQREKSTRSKIQKRAHMVLLYQYAFHILAFFLEDSRREDEKHFDIPAAHDRISIRCVFSRNVEHRYYTCTTTTSYIWPSAIWRKRLPLLKFII